MPTIYQIKPTVLMVKKHNKTGLLYFCKTVRLKSIFTYTGSGVAWKEHLKEHGKDFSTVWVSDVFTNSSIKDFALKFSSDHNIVESPHWANMIEENGIGGGFGELSEESKESKSLKLLNHPVSIETRKAISLAQKDKPKTEDHKKKIADTLRNVPASEETKHKMRESAKLRPSATCLSCKKTVPINMFYRWHGDNCRLK